MKPKFALLTILYLAATLSAINVADAVPKIPICKGGCKLEEVCINTFTEIGAKCSSVPQPATITFWLPVDEDTEMVCTHSLGSGSHSGKNAYFALDLATPYDKPAAVIRAAADGVAYVYGAESGGLCPEPKGSAEKAEASKCGMSWGNRIKILHHDGYFSFYVHLDHFLVKTGDKLKAGDPIGIEGWTGAAGHRHLHWSVQKLPGNTQNDWENEIDEYTGESVPFSFFATQNKETKTFDVKEVVCAHAGIGEAPDHEQPRFYGVPVH